MCEIKRSTRKAKVKVISMLRVKEVPFFATRLLSFSEKQYIFLVIRATEEQQIKGRQDKKRKSPKLPLPKESRATLRLRQKLVEATLSSRESFLS